MSTLLAARSVRRGLVLAAVLGVVAGGAARAQAAYEPDTDYGTDGRFVAHAGALGGGLVRVSSQDAGGGLLLTAVTLVGERPVLALARLHPDGSRDTALAGGEATLDVGGEAIDVAGGVRQPSGRLVLAVRRWLATGPPAGDLLVGVTPAGELDPAFGDGGIVAVGTIGARSGVIAVDTAGRLLVLEDGGVRRRTPTGEIDAGFGTGGTGGDLGMGPLALAVAPGSDAPTVPVVAAGGLAEVAGERVYFPPSRVSRFAANGRLDETFDGDGRVVLRFGGFGNDFVSAVLPGRTGGARLVGHAWLGESSGLVVVAITPDGALDPDWGSRGIGRIGAGALSATGAAAMPDGGVAVAGHDLEAEVLLVGRFGADGRAKPGFGEDGLVRVAPPGTADALAHAVAPEAGGGLLVAGAVSPQEGDVGPAIARLDPEGEVDSGYGHDGWAILPPAVKTAGSLVRSVVPAPDGTATVVLADPGTQVATFRLLGDGTVDPRYGDDGLAVVRRGDVDAFGALRDASGRLIMAVSEWDGRKTTDVVALDATGHADPSFGVGGVTRLDGDTRDQWPTAMNIDAGGALLVAGGWSYGRNDPWGAAWVARLDAGGTPDESFGAGGTVFGPAKDERTQGAAMGVIAQPDGRIVLGGMAGQNELRMAAIALAPARAPGAEPTPTPTPRPAQQDLSGTQPGSPAMPPVRPRPPAVPIVPARPRVPARFALARARIRDRSLSLLASIDPRASNLVRVRLTSAGRTRSWRILPRRGTVRLDARLPAAMRAGHGGLLTLDYPGDLTAVAPASVTVRAGGRSPALRVRTVRAAGRLVVSGSLAPGLAGRVRLELRDAGDDRVLLARHVRVRGAAFIARLPGDARGQLVVTHTGTRRGGFGGAVVRRPVGY